MAIKKGDWVRHLADGCKGLVDTVCGIYCYVSWLEENRGAWELSSHLERI